MCYNKYIKAGEYVQEENKNKTNEYDAEIASIEEERIAKNSNKKVLVIIMRCILGIFGIDKFIMGCKKKGIEDLIITGSLILAPIASLLLILIPYIGLGLFWIVLFFSNIVVVIRILYSLVSGLRMINLTPREIALKYEKMM